MPRTLLDEALAHADRAEPAVAAAIWLRAARVMMRYDRAAARRLIDRGVTAARALDASNRHPLMHTAISMAATVDPAQAIALAEHDLDGHLRDGAVSQAFFHMADHGLVDEAAAILSDPPERLPFPYIGVTNIIARAKDDNTRRRILESAVRAYRRERRSRVAHSVFGRSHFESLFTLNWRRLPPEIALATVRDLVQDALDDPDTPVRGSGSFGATRVQFSSSRQQRLFGVLEPLKALDPALAELLIAAHSQLAKAAKAMPFGMYGDRSAEQPARPDPHEPREPIEQPDFIPIGGRLMPMPEALATGFAEAFVVAERKFEDDTGGGNEAPKEAWPSAQEYRTILYKAGRHQGREATRYLDRIRDPDLRVLAAIELAAALSDLPQVGGVMSAGARGRAGHDRGTPTMLEKPKAWAERALGAWMARRHQHQPLPVPTKPDVPASREVRISKSGRTRGDRPAGGAGSDFWTMEGVPLRAVLSKIYDTPDRRIELPAALDDGRFDFMLVLDRDESHETMKRMMRESINRHFRIEVVHEPHERDVYVVTAPDGMRLKPGLDENMRTSSVSHSSRALRGADQTDEVDAFDLYQVLDLHMAGETQTPEDMMRIPGGRPMGELTGMSGEMTIKALCDTLEASLDRLVVNETGLVGLYEFKFKTEASSTSEFLDTLRREAGLAVTPARRQVPLLVARPAP
jgi:uncharacterized protein (TIGR03435 family)